MRWRFTAPCSSLRTLSCRLSFPDGGCPARHRLAALDVLPAEEAAGRNEDKHQRNIREYYGLSLNPKASHAEIEEFERRHRIRLPADYRTFVTEVGNGGCGTGEGLYRFQHSAGSGWSRYSLGRPFPLTGYSTAKLTTRYCSALGANRRSAAAASCVSRAGGAPPASVLRSSHASGLPIVSSTSTARI